VASELPETGLDDERSPAFRGGDETIGDRRRTVGIDRQNRVVVKSGMLIQVTGLIRGKEHVREPV